MNARQLAQRLGVDIKQLDFELSAKCTKCRKVGGTEAPCEQGQCVVLAVIEVREDQQ